jgi:hypothetical protein
MSATFLDYMEPHEMELDEHIGNLTTSDLREYENCYEFMKYEEVPYGIFPLAATFISRNGFDRYFFAYNSPEVKLPYPSDDSVLNLQRKVIPNRFASFAHEHQIVCSRLSSHPMSTHIDKSKVEDIVVTETKLNTHDLLFVFDWIVTFPHIRTVDLSGNGLHFRQTNTIPLEAFLKLVNKVDCFVIVLRNACIRNYDIISFNKWPLDRKELFFKLIWLNEDEISSEHWYHFIAEWAMAEDYERIRSIHRDFYSCFTMTKGANP